MQNQQDDKNSMAILYIIGSVFVVSLILWLSFEDEFKFAFIKIRYWQSLIIYLFFRIMPSSIDVIYDLQVHTYDLVQVTKQLTPENLNMEYASQLSEEIGMLIRFPLSIILLFFCYLMYGRNVKMRYKKIYSMQSLAKQEAATWPQINPVVGLDIAGMDLTSGPWSMSLSPIDFCKQFKLMHISIQYGNSNMVNKAPKFVINLDENKTHKVFTTQLGNLWSGANRMPIHKRAMMAALLARGCRDGDASRALLNQINKSCVGGKIDRLDFSGADALLKKYINNIEVKEILKRHAYENTLFMAILTWARLDGVLPTADFLWLKPFDRQFWYVLNTVGRQTPCCEAAGIHAHYLAEKALRRPISTPLVDEALTGLKRSLDEIKYVPTTEEKNSLISEHNKENKEDNSEVRS